MRGAACSGNGKTGSVNVCFSRGKVVRFHTIKTVIC
jgi:hypothetical protein